MESVQESSIRRRELCEETLRVVATVISHGLSARVTRAVPVASSVFLGAFAAYLGGRMLVYAAQQITKAISRYRGEREDVLDSSDKIAINLVSSCTCAFFGTLGYFSLFQPKSSSEDFFLFWLGTIPVLGVSEWLLNGGATRICGTPEDAQRSLNGSSTPEGVVPGGRPAVLQQNGVFYLALPGRSDSSVPGEAVRFPGGGEAGSYIIECSDGISTQQ